MPLSKKQNRERMKASRATCVQPNPVHPVRPDVQPKPETVGLKMDGHRIVGLIKAVKEVKSDIPIYDPSIHKPGDRVLIKSPYSKKMQEIVIPSVDADGHSYEE